MVLSNMLVKAFRTGFAAPKLRLGDIRLILLALPTNCGYPMCFADNTAPLLALSKRSSLFVLLQALSWSGIGEINRRVNLGRQW